MQIKVIGSIHDSAISIDTNYDVYLSGLVCIACVLISQKLCP